MKHFRWPLAVISTLLSLSLSGCGWWDSRPAAPLPSTMTPKAGGMVLPTALPAQPVEPEAVAAVTNPLGLQAGQLVVVVSPAGLNLYGDATLASETRNVYPAGTTLTVLEPGSAYTAYPVRNDDHAWYRFQAADGLVGWAMIEEIVPVESLPTATATPAG